MCMSANRRGQVRPTLRRVAVASLAGGLCACAVGPTFVPPSVPPVTHYTQSEDPAVTTDAQGTAQRFTPAAQVAADWWQLFNSAKLDALVEEAMIGNPGIEASRASLRQSE